MTWWFLDTLKNDIIYNYTCFVSGLFNDIDYRIKYRSCGHICGARSRWTYSIVLCVHMYITLTMSMNWVCSIQSLRFNYHFSTHMTVIITLTVLHWIECAVFRVQVAAIPLCLYMAVATPWIIQWPHCLWYYSSIPVQWRSCHCFFLLCPSCV